MKLLRNISQLVVSKTNPNEALRGAKLGELEVITNAALLFDSTIHWFGAEVDLNDYISVNSISIDETINANGRCVMTGFVDSHTHIVFGGDRANEFGQRLRGATYQEIATAGGGIAHTVEKTRLASFDELYQSASKLLESAIRYGTTTIEIKSGYSLNFEGEIKQLEVIKELQKNYPLEIVSTFMGAHDFPKEYKSNPDKYVDIICNEMLPYVAENKLAEYCDAFIDEGYFTVAQTEKIFDKAVQLGFKLKLHADELVNKAATEFACRLETTSVDHLLMISQDGINALASSSTIGTLLPATAYFIRMPYAPARQLIDANCAIAIATDCNPGSSFTENMQTVLSLSAMNMRMTAEECLNAATINAAFALDRQNKSGSITVGKRADFLVLDSSNYLDLFYHFGINHVAQTWIAGNMYSSYDA